MATKTPSPKPEPKRTAGNTRPKKSYVDFAAILRKAKHTSTPPEITNSFPTGLTLLDAMMGNGFPGGRFAQVHGEEMTLKSAFTYHQGAIVQQMGGSVWIDDREDKFNADVARINGLQFGSADTRGSFYYTQSKTFDEYLALLLNWIEISRESEVPMLAVEDSLGSISTKQQQEAKIEHPMSIAKKMAHWLSTADLGNLTNSMLFPLWINQQRDGVDFFSYGPPKPKLPGGRAVKFKTATRIKMSVQALAAKDKDKEVAAPIGKLSRFQLEKACTGPDGRWCLVPYFYHFGFDDGLSCLNYLIGMNYIKKGTEEGTKLLYGIDGTYYSKAEWRRMFYEDPGVRREIRNRARAAYIADNNYQGGESDAGDEEE